ncbi:hypothetical protein RFI_10760, partial [Reticulomyxa filosa]
MYILKVGVWNVVSVRQGNVDSRNEFAKLFFDDLFETANVKKSFYVANKNEQEEEEEGDDVVVMKAKNENDLQALGVFDPDCHVFEWKTHEEIYLYEDKKLDVSHTNEPSFHGIRTDFISQRRCDALIVLNLLLGNITHGEDQKVQIKRQFEQHFAQCAELYPYCNFNFSVDVPIVI